METIRRERDGGITRIVMDRPAKRNALTGEMVDQLIDYVESALADARTTAIVLMGGESAFCSGQDLSERVRRPGAPPPDLGTSLDERWNRLVRAVGSGQKPVISAVRGVAAGAGANLALSTTVVAAEDAMFVQSFARVALMPDSGGTWLLPASCGRARTLGLAMLAEPINGRTAAEWGMIWRAAPSDRVEEEAHDAARRIGRDARMVP